MSETRICEVCGKILDESEIDICDDCKASIVLNEDIFPNESDLW